MNQSDKSKQEFNNDELRAFLISEESEKAPVDFTEKIMELIRKESLPIVNQSKWLRLSTVPVIYCALLAILMIIALFIPNSSNYAANSFSWLPSLDNLFSAISKIEFDILSNITMTYIMIVCLGLFILDLILFKYFKFSSKS